MNFEYPSSPSRSIPFPIEELFSTSSIIFYQCSVQENLPLLFITENVKDILGIVATEFEQDDTLWMDRIHPEDRELVLGMFDNVLEEEVFSTDYRFRHGDGHYIWLYDEVKLVRDDDGNPESLIGTSIDITERKQAEQDLQKLNEQLEQRIESRTQDLSYANNRLKLLEMAIANINDMVIITKAPNTAPLDSEIVFVNKAFEIFTLYSREEVLGERPTFLHGAQTDEKTLNYINNKICRLEPVRAEFINYKKDGSEYWVELDMAPFPAEHEDEMYWVGINRDISQRKQAEQQIRESLKEKEVLLSEIHHRVKNNLAIISGLLDLQAFNEDDEQVMRKLREGQARIQSIAMVHEKLYQSESLSSIQMNTYIDQLTDYIKNAFTDQAVDVSIHNQAEPIALDVHKAIPCGLILNELITNAFKHAFVGMDQGTVSISFRKVGDSAYLEIRDDGVGLPDGINYNSSGSLGVTLVQTLIDQLEADFEISSGEDGTTLSISFDIEE